MRSTDPVIPQIAAGLDVEPATAALLSTAFTLPYALVQPVLGALADMFSKARLMLLCMLIVDRRDAGLRLGDEFRTADGARVLAGLAAGGVLPIAFALVGDMVPVAQRQVAMGRLLFAIMTGNLLGATCAGVIGDLVGWRGVFFVTGGFGAASRSRPPFPAFAASAKRRPLRSVDARCRTIARSSAIRWRRSASARCSWKRCSCTACFPYIATMLHEAGETRASIAGIVIAGFGIGGALYGVTVSRLLPLLGETRMMRDRRHGDGLLPGGDRAARCPGRSSSSISCCSASASTCCTRCIQVYVSELAPAARGSAMALHSFFFFLGQAVGPDRLRRRPRQRSASRRCCCSARRCWSASGLICAQWLRRPAAEPRSSRARDRARRPGRAARRPSAVCRSARTRRSACRRADTSSRRCAAISA